MLTLDWETEWMHPTLPPAIDRGKVLSQFVFAEEEIRSIDRCMEVFRLQHLLLLRFRYRALCRQLLLLQM